MKAIPGPQFFRAHRFENQLAQQRGNVDDPAGCRQFGGQSAPQIRCASKLRPSFESSGWRGPESKSQNEAGPTKRFGPPTLP